MDIDELKALGVEDESIAEKLLGKYGELSDGITKLKGKNDELISEKRKATSKLQEIESQFGEINPEKYREMQEKLSKIDEKHLIDKEKFSELNEVREKKMKEEMGKRDVEYSSLLDKYKKKMKDVAISNATVETHGKKTLPKVLNQDIDVIEEDGEYIVIVLDEKGQPKYSESGEYMTTVEYATLLMEDDDYKSLFNVKELNGGGAPYSKGRAGGAKQAQRDVFNSWSQIERKKFLSDGGKIV